MIAFNRVTRLTTYAFVDSARFVCRGLVHHIQVIGFLPSCADWFTSISSRVFASKRSFHQNWNGIWGFWISWRNLSAVRHAMRRPLLSACEQEKFPSFNWHAYTTSNQSRNGCWSSCWSTQGASGSLNVSRNLIRLQILEILIWWSNRGFLSKTQYKLIESWTWRFTSRRNWSTPPGIIFQIWVCTLGFNIW